jgi:branched-chain amino acid aminotransferase
MDFIIVNGEVLSGEELHSDSFLAETKFSITHKIWFGYGGIPLFHENMELLQNQTSSLNLTFPEEFNDRREFFRIVKRMLNKNKYFRSGIVKLILNWNNKNTFTLVKSQPSIISEFPFSDKGILLNASNHRKFSGNAYNKYSFYNEKSWALTQLEIEDTTFGSSVILNEKGNVCECPGNNIYFFKGKKLITPSTKTGCYQDITRDIILELAEKAGFQVEMAENLKFNDLPGMDEIFSVSEINGFQWIIGVHKKRFVRNYSHLIYQNFVELLKQKVL